MVLRSDKNEYRGVNAHLHSAFQDRGGWEGFHNAFVFLLAQATDTALPAGYRAVIEQSLQIRLYHPDTGETLRRPQPDSTILREPSAPTAPATAAGSELAPTLEQSVAATLSSTPEQYYTAVVIQAGDPDAARPVTLLELLSPSNKVGDGGLQYREKRRLVLENGLRLVEIDLLHQTPSPVNGVPAYPHEPGAFAYNITISNPHPSLTAGWSRTYGFGVDDPLPALPVPLEDDDRVTLDFNAIYQRAFGSLRTFSASVDYADLPAHLDSYSAADQARIRQRMADVAARPR